MFTTCPKCSLKLIVTAADLRVAQGFVRCGRCSNVFNALAGLSDEQQAVLAREPQPAPPGEPQLSPHDESQPALPDESQPAPPDEPQRSAPDERPSPAARDEEPIPDESLEFDASATDVSEVFVESADDDPTGTFESIVLRGEDDSANEPELHELELDLEALVSAARLSEAPAELAPESAAEPEAALDTQSVTAEESPTGEENPAAEESPATEESAVAQGNAASRGDASVPERAAGTTPDANAAPRSEPTTVSDSAVQDDSAPGADLRTHAEARSASGSVVDPASSVPDGLNWEGEYGLARGQASPRSDRFVRIGIAALALILVLQIVHHERARLADIGWLRAPLTAVYSALGIRLVPHWDVHAYEVRQLGAVAGPRNPGALTVRASVKNTARREQPLPLLRVTMQDRFGSPIAARDVPPKAYLPASAHRADLAAGQRVDAEITFADPGPNAVGFEIDACLELAGGRIACANDTSTRR